MSTMSRATVADQEILPRTPATPTAPVRRRGLRLTLPSPRRHSSEPAAANPRRTSRAGHTATVTGSVASDARLLRHEHAA